MLRQGIGTVLIVISPGELALLNAAVRVVQQYSAHSLFKDLGEAVPLTVAYDVVWQLQSLLQTEGCTDHRLTSVLDNLSELFSSLDSTAERAVQASQQLVELGCQELLVHLITIGLTTVEAL